MGYSDDESLMLLCLLIAAFLFEWNLLQMDTGIGQVDIVRGEGPAGQFERSEKRRSVLIIKC